MKTFTYSLDANIDLLQQELDFAFPQFRGTPVPGGFKNPQMRMDFEGLDIWIHVPDSADEAAFDAVISAHDNSGETEEQRRNRRSNEEKTNIRGSNNNAAASMGDLKALAKAVGVDWIW